MTRTRIITLDGAKIADWDDFHELFVAELGFPDWYGRNLDAWIDVMTYLDTDRETTRVFIEPGETITLKIQNWERLRDERPDILTALVECSAFVNYRKLEGGEDPYLLLAFFQ